MLHRPDTEQAPTRRKDWAESYASRLLVTDVVVIVWAVFGSQIAWFGLAQSNVSIKGHFNSLSLSYTAVSIALSIAWMIFISAAGSRDLRVVGSGAVEYQRLASSSLMLFGLMAIASYLLKAELARGYFVTALPMGLTALLISRWVWRQYLHAKRTIGELSSRVVLVGSVSSATTIGAELHKATSAGYLVIGAYVPSGDSAFLEGTNIPILGYVDDVVRGLDETCADTVIVTSSDVLPPEGMRKLSWSLEPGRQHLVVAPGLTDVAGPRIHTRPVAGLPLVHIETPRYEGSKRAVKRIFDVVVSALLLVLLALPLALVSALIKATSHGPVLFRQARVGINGKPFMMLKLRSMVADAEARLVDVSDGESSAGNHIMFKMIDDPRVTPIGKIMRRLSIDELPQIINVLRGDMSLVGPRPPLQSEVELYEKHVNRRFLVKPGITGLWQVSGRSNLDWEDTVRLDLFYVENWSFTGDLIILWRTIRAVLAKDGAF